MSFVIKSKVYPCLLFSSNLDLLLPCPLKSINKTLNSFFEGSYLSKPDGTTSTCSMNKGYPLYGAFIL